MTNEDVMKEMRGKTKAALLLSFLGSNGKLDIAHKIIGTLDSGEKEILFTEVSNLERFDTEAIQSVLKEFIIFVKGQNIHFTSGNEMAMKLIEGTVKGDELEEIMSRLYNSSNEVPFSTFKKIKDVGPLLTFLQGEDAQTIAVFASYLKPNQAAELIQSLPERKMIDVSTAIAKMDQTNKDILSRVEEVLNKKLEAFQTDDNSQTDGIKTLVNILNNVSRSTERTLFDALDKEDTELSRDIKDNMFVFEDLVSLRNLDLQKVIGKLTDNALIAMSLKRASNELKEKIYQCMAEGKKVLVEDAAEGLGGVRQSDVEEAQKKIANIVKDMEKNNEIIIQRGDDNIIL